MQLISSGWTEPNDQILSNLAAENSTWGDTSIFHTMPFVQHFELNDPIAAFVSVTGLVFALVFASNYTDAQVRETAEPRLNT